MTQDFNQYQIAALQQLADYRGVFTAEQKILSMKTKPVKGSKVMLQQFTDTFIDIFCQNNFADTDYTTIQHHQQSNMTMLEWVKNMNIRSILQCLTYAIWTDKSFDGFFLRKINDRTIELLLTRLDIILNEHYQLKLQHSKLINGQQQSA